MDYSIGLPNLTGQKEVWCCEATAKSHSHPAEKSTWCQLEFEKMLFYIFLFYYLDKSDLAVADIAAAVLDGNLPVVLNPTLAAQNVVDAGRHLVPLVVVSAPEWKES